MSIVDREQFMVGLMDGAIASATMILRDEPQPPSMDNKKQQEAAIFLNNPWVVANLIKGHDYLKHPSLSIKYVERLKEALCLPNGSARVLRKLAKAQSVLLGE